MARYGRKTGRVFCRIAKVRGNTGKQSEERLARCMQSIFMHLCSLRLLGFGLVVWCLQVSIKAWRCRVRKGHWSEWDWIKRYEDMNVRNKAYASRRRRASTRLAPRNAQCQGAKRTTRENKRTQEVKRFGTRGQDRDKRTRDHRQDIDKTLAGQAWQAFGMMNDGRKQLGMLGSVASDANGNDGDSCIRRYVG